MKHIKPWRPEQWFLLLFIPLALSMMIALPVFRAPDEKVHLEQIYTMATGQWPAALETQQVQLPQLLHEIDSPQTVTHAQVRQLMQADVSDAMVAAPVNSAAAIYPPLSYLPQVLGMRLTMLLTEHQVLHWYGARLGNLICVTILLYFAIRMIPAGKHLMMIFALLPLNLQQMISASADGVTTALAYLFLSFVLYAAAHKPRFGIREYLLLLFLCIGLASWKIAYFPLVLLALLLPRECFSSKRVKALTIGGAYALSALMTLVWAAVCYFALFQSPMDASTSQTVQGFGAMLQQPLAFFRRLFATLGSYGISYVVHIFCYNQTLSWFNVDAGLILPTISLILTFIVFLTDEPPFLRLRDRSLMLFVSALSTLALFLMLHIWHTPLNRPMIEGFQARYLLPLLTPAALAIRPGKRQFAPRLLPWLTAGSALVSLGFIGIVFSSTLA